MPRYVSAPHHCKRARVCALFSPPAPDGCVCPCSVWMPVWTPWLWPATTASWAWWRWRWWWREARCSPPPACWWRWWPRTWEDGLVYVSFASLSRRPTTAASLWPLKWKMDEPLKFGVKQSSHSRGGFSGESMKRCVTEVSWDVSLFRVCTLQNAHPLIAQRSFKGLSPWRMHIWIRW